MRPDDDEELLLVLGAELRELHTSGGILKVRISS